MTALRNGLAATVAVLLILLVGRALAPTLTAYLPSKDAVSGVLGLVACLLPTIYKLLDGAMTAIGFGGRPPALSRWVSVLAGAAVMALIYGAFNYATTNLVEQTLPLLKASPGTAVTVGKVLLHLELARAIVEFFAALMIGSWAGRRHGRPAAGVVAAISLLSVAAMVAVEAMAGMGDMAGAVSSVRSFAHAPSMASAQATPLPLLLGVFVVGLIGAWLGGGARSRQRGNRPLMLGA